ncbi:sensor histidine kinase [Mycobacterium sp.]|uniref:sensor histidine kinase n=1 Tax=Mycobacterium sp. TaxID=1785 RepID=UPI002D39FA2F|nr:sensor histidine kinase [Mycobacterium sp.]HZA10444.1 sensor histidine kinase [Mycobacterium sp.]
MSTSTQRAPGRFVHPAIFYRSPQEYLNALVPFIVDAVDSGYPALVAVPESNLALLGGALGDTANDVMMLDMTRAGRNPGRILGGVLSAFADEHRDRPVRMIGEPIWVGRTAAEYPACVQHEALINFGFGKHSPFSGRDVTMLCAYDASSLEARVLSDARITHPVVWEDGSSQSLSPDYAPEEVLARYNEPLTNNPAAAAYAVQELTDLRRARTFVARYGQLFGLSPDRIVDLKVIATELATNSLQHTDNGCRLALWHHDGHVVCEARDTGHLDDPLAGRRPPSSATSGGRGLFVINALADLVRIHTHSDGTTIQAYLRRD